MTDVALREEISSCTQNAVLPPARGGRWECLFAQHTVPQAVIELKQGFGRARRRPEDTVLHQVVREHLETFWPRRG